MLQSSAWAIVEHVEDTARPAHAWRLETDLVLVESYRPAADHAAFLDLFAPARQHTLDRLADGGPGVRFVGAIVVPGDEVVFYLVAARSLEQVRELVAQAGLAAVRIVPASWAAPI
ncbi:MAG TPA: hypothetical protein VMP67_05830 [Candidatus Limnocylindria bacterium]|nr:hypothetical protein [Candidatus Limnocylindria bacterium]